MYKKNSYELIKEEKKKQMKWICRVEYIRENNLIELMTLKKIGWTVCQLLIICFNEDARLCSQENAIEKLELR